MSYNIVILGLSVTSSWGNGHATTYRSLIAGLAKRGHRILFLERDQPWYAANRDNSQPAGARTQLYRSVDELRIKYSRDVSQADLVIVGSFVPDGVAVGEWVTSVARGRTAFYDIDTPLTLEKLSAGECTYLTPELIPRFDCYLSFTGGPTLARIESELGSPLARALYCSVDCAHYSSRDAIALWDLAYLGTYSEDRQAALETLLVEPAQEWQEGSFMVAGPDYSAFAKRWPPNIDYRTHLSPAEHPGFYAAQRYGLNLTRQAMKAAGYSPSVRLFEAAACAVPIISDWWPGLDSLFEIGKEILVADDASSVLRMIRDIPEEQRKAIGEAARERVLAAHTAEHRAAELEHFVREIYDRPGYHSRSGIALAAAARAVKPRRHTTPV